MKKDNRSKKRSSFVFISAYILLFASLGACREEHNNIRGGWSIIRIVNVEENEINNNKPYVPSFMVIIRDDLKSAVISPYINDQYRIELDFDFNTSHVGIRCKEILWWNGNYEFKIYMSQSRWEILKLTELTSEKVKKEIVFAR